MLERKLVICDLDGTLLNNNQKISSFSIKTINKLQENGHVFCIATGRPIRSAVHYYNQLGLKTIMANLNGSIISNPSDMSFSLINLTFSREILKWIFNKKKLLKYIGCIFIENVDGAYVLSNDNNEFIKSEFLSKFHVDKDTDNVNVLKLSQYNLINKDINSILIYIKNKEHIDEVTFMIKNITSTLIVRSWSLPQDNEGTVIEINSIFSTKGTVAKFLSSYYAIPLQNTYTFGDGENDIEMLQKCNGFAMKNGGHTAKLLSGKITSHTNDDDGVARQLIKIFGL